MAVTNTEAMVRMRVLVAGFFVAHGAIHAAIWMSPAKPGAPFEAAHSWLFGDVRVPAMVLAAIAAVAFLAAGIAYLGGHDWWALTGTAGAAVSVGLIALTFTPWWLAALAINIVLIALAWPAVTAALR